MKKILLALFLCLPLMACGQTRIGGSGGSTVIGATPAAILTLTPQLSFSHQQVGTSSAAMPATLSVTGADATIFGIVINSGADPGDYGQTNNCPGILSAGTSCTISVTFTPAATGSRQAILTVTSNASSPTITSNLGGDGITAAQSATTVSPNILNFPNTNTGSSSASQNITLTSSGTATLNISSITISGTNAGDFSKTTTCGGTLGITLSCTITVTFTPTTTGARTAQVNINSDSLSSPDVVTLNGTGTNPTAPLTFVTTSLANANIGVAYSQTLVGTGGTPAYTWSITSGSLAACNLSLNASTGAITGTPASATTCTATFKLTDTVCVGAGCPTQVLSVVVSLAAIGENVYCPSNEVSTLNGTFDETAQLPSTCVNTALVNTPSPGSVLTVIAGSSTDLQSKFNSVVCGQTIQIPANQTYQGNYTISKSCGVGQWITIETDQIASLPPEGTRITPSYAGQDYPRGPKDDGDVHGYPVFPNAPIHGNYMPKLITNTATPLITITSSSRIRFIGLELTTQSGIDYQNVLVPDNGNDHIIFDRVWAHGGDSATETSTSITKQGIVSNSFTYIAIVDSRLTDFFCKTNVCVEAQTIAGGNGTGGNAMKIYNSFLSSAGEPFFAGGASATGVPVDYEIRHNHTFMPLFWLKTDPNWDGVSRTCKNTGEMKTGQRILIEGNIFENSFGTCVDQNGYASTIGPKSQGLTSAGGTANSDGAGNITWVSGPVFDTRVVDAGCATPNHCHLRWNGEGGFPHQVNVRTDNTHISITPIPAVSTSTPFVLCYPGGGPTVQITDLTSRYNILKSMRNNIGINAVPSDCGDLSLGIHRVSYHDLITDNFNGPAFTLPGGCCTFDVGVALVNGQTGSTAVSDLVMKHVTFLPFVTSGSPGQQYIFNFSNSVHANITNLTIKDSIGISGIHQNDGSNGQCFNITGTTNVLNCESPATWCFTGNVITTGSFSGQPVNPLQSPFPTSSPGGSGPGCAGPSTNYTAADYTAVGFVNLNGANGGDYHLSNVSAFKGLASDGTDPGANVTTVNNYTSGTN